MTTAELAAVGAAFAGTPPGDRAAPAAVAVSAATQSATLATMLHCGMYEQSGEWGATVGVPAKSGVGGAVWASIPGVGGVCAHQPRIDNVGNSVQAMALIRGMAARLPGLSVFNAGL